MVALLVAISVMAILMTAAMPAWHTMVQREKEAELVFRGEQIARAIGLYQRRFANAPAPSIDFLVEQRFLRKKYKDPITNDDFQVLTSGTNTAAPGQISSAQSSVFQQLQSSLGVGRGGAATAVQGRGGTPTGGIIGVTSKSPLKSLRLYNGRDTYDQWVFVPVVQAARAGGPAGRGAEGGRAGGRGPDTGRAGGRGGDGGGLRGGPPQGPARGRGGQGGGGRGGFELPPTTRGRF